MFKILIFGLDLIAIATIIFAPALLVPSYIFGKDVGSVAIIGGEGPASIFLTVKAMKFRNFIFPVFILLIACNLYCLFAFLRKRFLKKETL